MRQFDGDLRHRFRAVVVHRMAPAGNDGGRRCPGHASDRLGPRLRHDVVALPSYHANSRLHARQDVLDAVGDQLACFAGEHPHAGAAVVEWAALAERVAALGRLPADLIEPVPTHALGYTARRPPYAVLASERGGVMPALDDALERYFQDALLEQRPRERRRSTFGASGDRRATAADRGRRSARASS